MTAGVMNELAAGVIQEDIESPIADALNAANSLLRRGGLSEVRQDRLARCVEHLSKAAIEAQYAYHSEPR